MGVGTGVMVDVGVGAGVWVRVGVGTGVGEGVGAGVAVSVGVGAGVSVGTAVMVGLGDGVSVGTTVGAGVGAGGGAICLPIRIPAAVSAISSAAKTSPNRIRFPMIWLRVSFGGFRLSAPPILSASSRTSSRLKWE